MLCSTVVIGDTRSWDAVPLITTLIKLAFLINEAVWAGDAKIRTEFTELVWFTIRITGTSGHFTTEVANTLLTNLTLSIIGTFDIESATLGQSVADFP